jgi:hypothetical protein
MWGWVVDLLGVVGETLRALVEIDEVKEKYGAPALAGVCAAVLAATLLRPVLTRYFNFLRGLIERNGSYIASAGLISLAAAAAITLLTSVSGEKESFPGGPVASPISTKRKTKIATPAQSPCAGTYCGIGGPDLNPFDKEDAAKLGPADLAEARERMGRLDGHFCVVREEVGEKFKINVTIPRDSGCQRWFAAFQGVIDLQITVGAQHGLITKYGRSWQYVPAKGYRGPDSFSIMRCFRTGIASSECLTLDYSVSVI